MTNETTPDVPAAAPAEATTGAEEESKPKAKPTQAVPRPDRKAVEKATGVLQADIDKINDEIKGYDAGIEKIKKEIESLNSARTGEQVRVPGAPRALACVCVLGASCCGVRRFSTTPDVCLTD